MIDRTMIAARLPAAFLLAALTLFEVAPTRAVTIETVPIGNAGNAPHPQYGNGAVEYAHRLGKYEVTNAEYVDFLNSVDPTGANKLALYSTSMTSDAKGGIVRNTAALNGMKYEVKAGRALNPVVFVSWYDSARFVNWLHNGQGNGSTESGAYTLLGGTPLPSNLATLARNAGARWWLPSIGELYKSAYHKNDGVTANYWTYPFSSSSIPSSDQPPGSGAPSPGSTGNFYSDDGVANGYNDGFAVTGSTSSTSTQNYLTDVGAYASSISPYGTFDQGGNVREWGDGRVSNAAQVFGGSWDSNSSRLSAANTGSLDHHEGSASTGFRVAAMPESSGGPLHVSVDFDSTVQFGGGDRLGPIQTKAGFRSWNANWSFDSTPSRFASRSRFLAEGVEFELQASLPDVEPGVPNFGSRLRFPGIGRPSDELLNDFVFVENKEGNFLCLTIGGLPVGSYQMTTWHYDDFHRTIAADVAMQIEVGDKQGNSIAAATTVVADHVPLSTIPQVFNFDVVSPGTIKEIVFRDGSSLRTSLVRLNGFTLVRVPEPGTLLLLLIGCAAAGRCRR